MRAVLSWMREFAPIEGEPDQIAAQLTSIGLVVEGVETVGSSWDGIVVARVVALRPHPEADKIQLVDVEAGDGAPVQVCCGAFNMAVGDKVPFATIGTVMPNGMEIAQRKLRGEMSNGMLCSGAELELSDDHDGIMILDPDLALGQPLATVLGVTAETVFDIDVEPNRPEALSVIGIARDLAAKQGVPFALPEPAVPAAGTDAGDVCSIRIQDGDLCPRFAMRVLRNVTNAQSPAWMQARLDAAGMRPISTIVDISNYVMLETGHPNHTFDLDTVPDGQLIVRRAREGETLTTLDGVERHLLVPDGSGIGRGLGDGVIANRDDDPISLAGVMGGFDTEISDATTNVLLEAAVWDRMSIAHTSRRLNLRSEASTRFERGVDPLGVERALDRFCELAAELTGAQIAPGVVVAEPHPIEATVVSTRVHRVNHLLGTDLAADKMIDLLSPIGFDCSPVYNNEAGAATFDVSVPTWRPDVGLEADIAEEVGRHFGYDNIENRVPVSLQAGQLSDAQSARRNILRAFAAAGCSEAMPMPFLAPGDLAAAGLGGDGLTLTNPLVAEESVLRTSLLPGLLKALAYNQHRGNHDVRLFEMGAVYLPRPDGELPDEPWWVAAVLGDADASDAVTTLRFVGAFLGLDLRVKNETRDGLHPTRSAAVIFRGKTIGEVGEVDPSAMEHFEASGRAGWLALQVDPLVAGLSSVPKAKKVSRFPTSDLDLAFVVPNEVPADAVRDSLLKAGKPLTRSVELFDVFRAESLGEDVRSLAFSIRLQADDRTLSDDDVSSARKKMIDEAVKRHSAQLR
ncbi:MAG: phenylalanine--tRNA ligase subunit beta [Acidimicrobiales bacterium]|nr:phenylalanine--tRNA ligase subunit beta [Acidimicrobiales bacterium]